MIEGGPKFNAMALGEIRVDFTTKVERKAAISVRAAFINSTTGTTHGWTDAGAGHGGPEWSDEVHEKLKALAAQIELELAQLHFNDVADVASSAGLSEYLDEGGGIEAPPA